MNRWKEGAVKQILLSLRDVQITEINTALDPLIPRPSCRASDAVFFFPGSLAQIAEAFRSNDRQLNGRHRDISRGCATLRVPCEIPLRTYRIDSAHRARRGALNFRLNSGESPFVSTTWGLIDPSSSSCCNRSRRRSVHLAR